ncbi:MAG: P-loop NTPase fold protein [Actinomycetota bacterium]
MTTAQEPSRPPSATATWAAFVSYSPGDLSDAEALVTGLDRRGIRCFLDREADLQEDALLAALRESTSGLELIGAAGLEGWGRLDLRAMLERIGRSDLPVVPVLLPKAPPQVGLPDWLREREWIDLRGREIDDFAIDTVASALMRTETGPRTATFSQAALTALTLAATMLGEETAPDEPSLRAAALLGALMASAVSTMAPTTGDVVRLVLSRQSDGRGPVETLLAAASSAGLHPIPDPVPTPMDVEALGATPAAPLIGDAFEAQRRTAGGIVDLRHVLATGADGGVPAGVLEELGVSMEELHAEWRASIRRTWPNESSEGWDALLRERLGGRVFELAGGFSADAVDPTTAIPIERDQLGVRPYVTMLASLIADSHTPMPLSIGLFGDWGSGKSYFMGLLRGQVETLAKSRSAGYCKDIRQIGFNAWHYADTNLWASLAEEIFEQLAGPRNPVVEQRKALEEQLIEKRNARVELEAAVLRADKETARLRLEVDQAASARRRSALDVLRAAAQTKTGRDKLDAAWKSLGVKNEADQARRLASELRSVSSENEPSRRILRKFGVPAIASATLIVIIAGIAAFALRSWFTGGGLAAVATLLGAAFVIVRRVVSGLETVRAVAAEMQDAPDAPELKKLHEAEAHQQVVQAQLDEVVSASAGLGRELADLSPGRRLYSFVTGRAEDQAYRTHLGLISTIRKDFQQLVALMNEWRARADKDEKTPLPIDRIVLYIDDLDRCSSQQVVDVLQAVHLLLAFELFVVVVGVDPRWLLRSVQTQYAELLTSPAVDQSGRWEASPQDYLEKIFNIPFALPHMRKDSFGQLLRSLAGEDESKRRGSPALDRAPVSTDDSAASEPGETDGRTEGSGTERTGDAIIAEPESGITRGIPTAEMRPMTADELKLLAALGPLVDTPREAKRLVNLYRMIRATRDLSTASGFLGDEQQPGEYQAVAILLGMVSAHGWLLNDVLYAPPRPDEGVLGGLLSREPTTRWAAFVADAEPRKDGAGVYRNAITGELGPRTMQAWRAIHTGLTGPTALVTLAGLDAFQTWAPKVVRFSFIHSLYGVGAEVSPTILHRSGDREAGPADMG